MLFYLFFRFSGAEEAPEKQGQDFCKNVIIFLRKVENIFAERKGQKKCENRFLGKKSTRKTP